MNIFEQATRQKVRFNCKGVIGVEDLWDLPLTKLNEIYRELNKKLKDTKEDSLLETKSSADETLELQIDILKHIVSIRLEENKAKQAAVERKAQKQKILSILAEKDDIDLRGKSKEDLEKMLAEL